MEVNVPFVADSKAIAAVESGQCELGDPAVSAQTFAAAQATSSDSRPDGAGVVLLAASLVIVGVAGMTPLGSPQGSSSAMPNARHGVERRRQHAAVLPVVGLSRTPSGAPFRPA